MNNLLLLHGALGAKSQFKSLERVLSSDFNVHSVNFTGHGGEKIPSSPFSIEMFADDVLEYLDVGGEKKVNFFGYSMGGYVALYLAKNYPKKIGRIFTLATKFRWNKEISKHEIKMLDTKKIKEKVPEFAEELKHRHSPQDWEKVVEKTAEMMINLGKKNTLEIEDYSSIEHQVMVGVGDSDKMVTIEETTEVFKKLKYGRLLVLPNTPHPLEQVSFERLEYEIREFFG